METRFTSLLALRFRQAVLIIAACCWVACELEERIWSNPFDPASDRSLWNPQGVQIAQVEPNQIRLSWADQGGEKTGFKIDRRIGSGEWQDEFATLDTVIGDSSTWTDFIDLKQLVAQPAIYYYRLYAYADTNYSQRVVVQITPVLPGGPTPVDVTSVTYTLSALTVEWEQSPDDNFKHYRLLQAASDTAARDTVTTLTDRTSTTYVLQDFDPTLENWFWIQVSDTTNQSVLGQGGTHPIDPPPQAAVLNPVTYQNQAFQISWSANREVDFGSYLLYQAPDREMSTKSEIFQTTSNIDTSYQVEIPYDRQIYFQVIVGDIWGLTTGSNVEYGTSYQIIAYHKTSTTDTLLYVLNMAPLESTPQLAVEVTSSYPVWFPDGTRIFFKYRNSAGATLEADGKNLNDFALHLEGFELISYDVSRDGSLIVFSTNTRAIYTIQADGSNLTQLTFPDSREQFGHPRFSPDGSQIVYWQNTDYQDPFVGRQDIYVSDVSGANPTRITATALHHRLRDPAWSPDGNTIVFVEIDSTLTELRPVIVTHNIYIISPDGSNRNLLHPSQPDSVMPDHNPVYGSLQWSPAGDYILFSSENTMYKIDLAGNLSDPLGSGRLPRWSPDGNRIIFSQVSSSGRYDQITIMNADGTDPVLITTGEGAQIQPRP